MAPVYPRYDLDPTFVKAVRECGWSLTQLSQLISWRIENIGQTLNDGRFVATPANVGRLHLLSKLIGFEGEIFEDASAASEVR